VIDRICGGDDDDDDDVDDHDDDANSGCRVLVGVAASGVVLLRPYRFRWAKRPIPMALSTLESYLKTR